MRKLLIAVVVAALVLDVGAASVWARRGGCGGGHRHHRHRHHGGGGGCASACSTCGGGGYGSYGSYGALPEGGGYYGADLPPNAPMLGAAIDQPATLFVDLPADATLTVDGTATTSTTSSRMFVTPPLQGGRTYHYTLTAQVMRHGHAQTVTRAVAVRAGEQTRVRLDIPDGAAAAS